jgi:hypothetical protein
VNWNDIDMPQMLSTPNICQSVQAGENSPQTA